MWEPIFRIFQILVSSPLVSPPYPVIIIIIYGIFKEISVPTTRIEHEKNVIMPNTVNIVYKNDKILF